MCLANTPYPDVHTPIRMGGEEVVSRANCRKQKVMRSTCTLYIVESTCKEKESTPELFLHVELSCKVTAYLELCPHSQLVLPPLVLVPRTACMGRASTGTGCRCNPLSLIGMNWRSARFKFGWAGGSLDFSSVICCACHSLVVGFGGAIAAVFLPRSSGFGLFP